MLCGYPTGQVVWGYRLDVDRTNDCDQLVVDVEAVAGPDRRRCNVHLDKGGAC